MARDISPHDKRVYLISFCQLKDGYVFVELCPDIVKTKKDYDEVIDIVKDWIKKNPYNKVVKKSWGCPNCHISSEGNHEEDCPLKS